MNFTFNKTIIKVEMTKRKKFLRKTTTKNSMQKEFLIEFYGTFTIMFTFSVYIFFLMKILIKS